MKIKIGTVLLVIILLLAVGCTIKNENSQKQTTLHENDKVDLESSELQIDEEHSELQIDEEQSELGDGRDDDKSQDLNLIVAEGSYLLGGSRDGNWINTDELYEDAKGEEVYKLYTFLGEIGEVKANEPVPSQGPVDYLYVDINNGSIENYREVEKVFEDIDGLSKQIAISGDWNALPRKPELQSNHIDVYSQIIKDILSQNNMHDAPVNILQNIKIDLEGDGIDEVIISASNIGFDKDNLHKPGAYSLIVFRKIIEGEVKNFIVAQSFYPDNNRDQSEVYYRYLVPFILDCNGDGKMEIIIEGRYYEGQGLEVLELQDNELQEVLANGVGL